MNVGQDSEDHRTQASEPAREGDVEAGAEADAKKPDGQVVEPRATDRADVRAKVGVLDMFERWSVWAPVAAAVVVFARFVHLGWYAQPQADDFDYSVLYTRYGFWGAQVKWFYGWNGRYFFNAATTAAVTLFESNTFILGDSHTHVRAHVRRALLRPPGGAWR